LRCLDAFLKTVLGKEIAIGLSSRGKAARYSHTFAAELPDHLTERRVLASDAGNVVYAQIFKAHHVLLIVHSTPVDCVIVENPIFYRLSLFDTAL
jgi:hypothetical protein